MRRALAKFVVFRNMSLPPPRLQMSDLAHPGLQAGYRGGEMLGDLCLPPRFSLSDQRFGAGDELLKVGGEDRPLFRAELRDPTSDLVKGPRRNEGRRWLAVSVVRRDWHSGLVAVGDPSLGSSVVIASDDFPCPDAETAPKRGRAAAMSQPSPKTQLRYSTDSFSSVGRRRWRLIQAPLGTCSVHERRYLALQCEIWGDIHGL